MTTSEAHTDSRQLTYRKWEWANLEFMTASQAKLFSAIALWGGQVDLSHNGQKISFVPGQRPKEPMKMLYLEAWIGNHAFDVYADPKIFQELIDNSGFQQSLKGLDMHTLTLACDHLSGSIIKSLNPKLVETFTILDAYLRTTTGPDDGLCLAVRSASQGDLPIIMAIPDNTVDVMATTLTKTDRKAPAEISFMRMTHSASYRAASVRLTAKEYAALQDDDGLMLPDGWSPNKIDRLVLGSSLAFPTEPTEDGLRIIGPATNTRNQRQGEPKMKHDLNLEVELSIEVARSRFDASTIESVSEGAIVQFPTAIGSYVTLLCNEEPVATGELVEIDGAFGVRITKTI